MACAVAMLYFSIGIHNEGVALRGLRYFSSKDNGAYVNGKKVKSFIKLIKAHVNVTNSATNPADMIRNVVGHLGQPIEVETFAVAIYKNWMTNIGPM